MWFNVGIILYIMLLSKETVVLPMECMSPLSILALSKLDMARIVQFLSALRLELVRFRPSAHFSSVASSEQSFSKFMNKVKNLQSKRSFG